MSASHEYRLRGRAGVTLVELLIVLMIGALIVTGTVSMLSANSKLFLSQRSTLASHNTIRSATAPLVWELRQASARGGDLYAIDSTSFALRSRIASGVVCAKDVPNGRYGLAAMTGEFVAGSADSALVYSFASQAWRRIAVSNIGTPVALGSPTACVYPGSPAPDVAIRLMPAVAADTAGIIAGAPVVLFRRVDHGLVQQSGKRWLMRKVGTANWEIVAGPLAPNGLRFTYFDSLRVVTTNPALVRTVRVRVVPETPGGPMIAPDTIRLHALLRN